MSDTSVAFRQAIVAMVLFAAAACAPERAVNHSTPVITGAPDESVLVSLPGNVRPEVGHREYDRGAVADSFTASHMLLQLQRSPVAEHALEQFIADQTDPTSPRYHQWLTAEQYGAQFGLADSDLAAVTGWLVSHNLHVHNINSARTVIDFSGNAAQIREAFHTELHLLNVDGVQHVANISDPQIPAALAPVVAGVVALHDFRPHTNLKPRAPVSYAAGNGANAMVPQDLATIYNITPLFDAGTSGQGEIIAVVEDSDVSDTNDWTTFRNKFALNAFDGGTFKEVHPAAVSGENNCAPPGINGAEGEAIIDAEWASAAAPSAAIVLASCQDTTFTFGGLLALNNLLDGASPPNVVSMSYGECETVNGAAQNLAFKTVYQQAVAQGVSVFVSSGDEGAASCDANAPSATHGIAVSGFASTPYNVAVGGTDFADTVTAKTSTYWSTHNSTAFGSALSYIPEIPWNDSCASVLFSGYFHYPKPYGPSGYCNSSEASGNQQITTGSGSGGPSGCATGVPSTAALVSGECRGYAKPSWQQSLFGVPDDGVRDIPDVSLFAANGYWNHYYVYCDSDPDDGTSCAGAPSSWPGVGGTSLSSPIMAGIQALVDQKWGNQGNPNPVYYQIAATEFGATGSSTCDSSKGKTIGSTCTFNDVTEGDIDVNCEGPYGCYNPGGTYGVLSTAASAGYAPAFAARAGWDFATGIGSVNAANLVANTAWGAGQSQLSWSPPHTNK